MKGRITNLTWVFAFLLVISCNNQKNRTFELLTQKETGLNFQNTLQQTLEFNVFDYMYFFNGGGVSSADFNNDGLLDLYFTANMGQNKMFLNQGGLKFKDVTEQAGVGGNQGGWSTGVSVIDINNDGLQDIYVSQVGDYEQLVSGNQLFVCTGIQNGIPSFEDQAIAYDLDLVGFSTQAAFADFDLDGDLDMFQLNHSLHQNGTFGQRESFSTKRHRTAGDKLLRNDNGRFVDVTEKSGILSNVLGYGLGLSVSDINFDGWPDIYIGNDFHENDYLYINQKNGTFKEDITNQMSHTSRFSMGVDAADINNDGFNDIISLDMHPYDPFILKSSLGEDPYDIFMFKIRFGYHEQYARNNLQINNGDDSFTEIGMFSGIHATDWSWSPLFVDFDNDGYKDLFISNGIPRRMNDIDYLNFMNADAEQKKRTLTGDVLNKDLQIIEQMPQIKLPNKFLKNEGNLKFSDQSEKVYNNISSYSNGALYADLDNDGDQDIVVNNIDDFPFIYENKNNQKQQPNGYLKIRLSGPENNKDAIGAKVMIDREDERLYYENFPVRGFQSSSTGPLTIGLGDTSQVNRVTIIWPDMTYQTIEKLSFNAENTVQWRQGLPKFNFEQYKEKTQGIISFVDITEASKLSFKHKENVSFVEFNREPLIPYAVSTEGPALAVGDINGDGLDDLFFGGAKRIKAEFFLQNDQGQFFPMPQKNVALDSIYEDVDAKFSDIDNDGDLDLIVASGGNEYWAPSIYLQQRLYLNDGSGYMERKPNAFSNMLATASTVSIGDFNQDGLKDVFFGARAVPRTFGEIPESHLFINKGNAVFEKLTDELSPSLKNIGLVKDSQWADIDGDKDLDLILAMDWDCIKLFRNQSGKLEEENLSQYKGWWNFTNVVDLDQDGDLDIIAGNTGLNNKLKPTENEPVRLYLNDFDDDGKKEQLLTYYVQGKEVPFATHAELTGRLTSLKKKYLYARDFAGASISEIFGKENLSKAKKLVVNNAASILLINDGNGNFTTETLPDMAQYSTLNTSVTQDFDQDGKVETFLAGNFYEVNIGMGRYDADQGSLLTLSKNNDLTIQRLGGLKIDGQVRNASPITINGKKCIVLAKNNNKAQIILVEKK